MADDFDDFDETPPAGSGIPGFILPVATAAVAVLAGVLLGAAVAWFVKPDPPPVEKIVPRELTDAELAAACAPFVLEKTEEIEVVQAKVDGLRSEVQAKEGRVRELEGEMAKRADRGRALVAELETLRAELVVTKQRLQVAEEEKRQLVEELKETLDTLEETEKKLVVQKEETRLAQEDALANKYGRFLGQSQLDICEKGNRKKLGRCRETVEELLNKPEIRDRFAHCVRSGQAMPSVAEAQKNVPMPDFSSYISQDEKVVKDWFIVFCDPTLPEVGHRREEHLPPTGR